MIRVVDIIDLVAEETGVTRNDIVAHRRAVTPCRSRRIAMYLATIHTPRSLPEVATTFGRDHSTVCYAVKMAKTAIETDTAFAATVSKLSAIIAGGGLSEPDLCSSVQTDRIARMEEQIARQASCILELKAELDHEREVRGQLESRVSDFMKSRVPEFAVEQQARAVSQACERRASSPYRPKIARPVPVTGRSRQHSQTNLTAALLGDPAPGRSAFDQQGQRP